MSIYGALGHRIHVLEKRTHDLELKHGIAREALEELLATVEQLATDDPTIRTRYAEAVDFAHRALRASDPDTANADSKNDP
jgi:hypothetical protein